LLERQKDNWVCGANNSPHEGKKDRGGVLQVQPLLRGNLNRSITRRHLASCEASRPPRHKSIEIVTFNVMIGAWVAIPREGACLTNSINRMRIAGFALAFAICCGVTEASAQLRAYVDVGGSGMGNATQGSAGLGTAGLGIGGLGSATENLGRPGLGDGGIGSSPGFMGSSPGFVGSNPGFSLPLLNRGSGDALGVTGNAGAAQGSLSSAIDRPSSPVDSVTNSLMGSVSTAVSRATATNPTGKPKQKGNAGATSSSGSGAAVASKVSPAKSP
jgi:hypothetical protein